MFVLIFIYHAKVTETINFRLTDMLFYNVNNYRFTCVKHVTEKTLIYRRGVCRPTVRMLSSPLLESSVVFYLMHCCYTSKYMAAISIILYFPFVPPVKNWGQI